MAFVDQDSDNDYFVNLSHPVDASGDWDDLYVVQAMLEFIYTVNPKLAKARPIRGPITVTGKPAKDTPILIAHFQKTQMKRTSKLGFINPALGKVKEGSTIWALNQHMTMILLGLKSPHTVISYLIEKFPLLASSLKRSRERHLESA
jgi:hypothetical protein